MVHIQKFVTKLFLNPLFRFFFWLAVTVWLIVLGIFSSGWIRWINFIMAIISLGIVIENVVKTVAYFKNTQN